MIIDNLVLLLSLLWKKTQRYSSLKLATSSNTSPILRNIYKYCPHIIHSTHIHTHIRATYTSHHTSHTPQHTRTLTIVHSILKISTYNNTQTHSNITHITHILIVWFSFQLLNLSSILNNSAWWRLTIAGIVQKINVISRSVKIVFLN